MVFLAILLWKHIKCNHFGQDGPKHWNAVCCNLQPRAQHGSTGLLIVGDSTGGLIVGDRTRGLIVVGGYKLIGTMDVGIDGATLFGTVG
jgi:hypothetical protein